MRGRSVRRRTDGCSGTVGAEPVWVRVWHLAAGLSRFPKHSAGGIFNFRHLLPGLLLFLSHGLSCLLSPHLRADLCRVQVGSSSCHPALWDRCLYCEPAGHGFDDALNVLLPGEPNATVVTCRVGLLAARGGGGLGRPFHSGGPPVNHHSQRKPV